MILEKWEFPGSAHRILYSKAHDSLFLGQLGKVVVLHPGDGSLLHMISTRPGRYFRFVPI